MSVITPTDVSGSDIVQKISTEVSPQELKMDMAQIFQRGVMAKVRIGAERFNWSLKLADLGVVPTRDKNRDEVRNAFDAVLPNKQRCSLLPKDQMYYYDETGTRKDIQYPEQTEREIRMLFPTRYTDADGYSRKPDMPRGATWLAIPLNGMTFIPIQAWSKWHDQVKEAERNHFASAQIIVDNYDRLKSSSIRHYMRISLDVYNRLKQTAPEMLQTTVTITTANAAFYNSEPGSSVATLVSPLVWMRRWKRAILAAWPSKEEIMRKYRVEPSYYWAPKMASEVDNWVDNEEKGWENDLIAEAEEIMLYRSIRQEVMATKSSQAHELASNYIRTILERVEMVFIGFMKTIESDGRGATSRQIGHIAEVLNMVKVLGTNVNGLDNIMQHVNRIEAYLNDSSDAIQGNAGNKAKKSALLDMGNNLPEILTRTLDIMRQEAESLIGQDARRTAFSDDDPYELLALIRSNGSPDSEQRRISSSPDEDAETEQLVIAPAMVSIVEYTVVESDNLGSGRRHI